MGQTRKQHADLVFGGVACEPAPEHEVGRRLHSRLRVFLPAKLTSVHGTQPVHLHNISQGGLGLHWSRPVRAGSDIVIAWAHHELFGTVVWCDREFGGISFDVPLPAALVLALRERETGAKSDVPRDAAAWYLENLRYERGRTPKR